MCFFFPFSGVMPRVAVMDVLCWVIGYMSMGPPRLVWTAQWATRRPSDVLTSTPPTGLPFTWGEVKVHSVVTRLLPLAHPVPYPHPSFPPSFQDTVYSGREWALLHHHLRCSVSIWLWDVGGGDKSQNDLTLYTTGSTYIFLVVALWGYFIPNMVCFISGYRRH